jgi:hypothetical protein
LAHNEYIFFCSLKRNIPDGQFFSGHRFCALDTSSSIICTYVRYKCEHLYKNIKCSAPASTEYSLRFTLSADCTAQSTQPRKENEFCIRLYLSIFCYSFNSRKSFVTNNKHHNQQNKSNIIYLFMDNLKMALVVQGWKLRGSLKVHVKSNIQMGYVHISLTVKRSFNRFLKEEDL